jgi:hypothetical protein
LIQVLLPEITNTDVSVVENSSTDIPLLTIAHGSTDKSIQYGISGRDIDFFNLKGFVIIDDFKRSAGSGESQGSSSSIYIGSTESANQKVGTLVIAKNDITIDTALGVLTKPFLSKQLLALKSSCQKLPTLMSLLLKIVVLTYRY